MSDHLEEGPSRKRRAGRELTREDIEAGNVSDDEPDNSAPKSFKKADENTLKTRQKVTVRRGAAGGLKGVDKIDSIFEKSSSNQTSSVPSAIVPTPTVASWKPVSLSFNKKPATSDESSKPEQGSDSTTTNEKKATESSSSTTTSTSSNTEAKSEVTSAKAAEESSKAAGSTTSTSSSSSISGGAFKFGAKPINFGTKSADSTSSSSSDSKPLFSGGFKFTANTNWSPSKPASSSDSDQKSETAAAGAGGAAAPSTTAKTWSFLGNSKPATEWKPTPIAVNFAKGTTGLESAKPGFLFGQNVAAPKKASETSPSSLPSSSEAPKSQASASSASKLLDGRTAPVNAGEENEDILFKADAKLAEFDAVTKTWIDRGVGNFKVNKMKDDASRQRLVMHAKHTLKLTLNTPIYHEMSIVFNEKQNTVIKFSGIPIPDTQTKEKSGEDQQQQQASKPTIVIFNVRFRDSETAALALKTMKEAVEATANKSDASSSKPAEQSGNEEKTKDDQGDVKSENKSEKQTENDEKKTETN